jgi:hypothetical protein
MIYISNANDTATVLADVDIFFLSAGYFQATDADEAALISSEFTNAFIKKQLPPYWGLGQQIAALIQVYDLVLPLDLNRALTLLSRLGAIADALLANRDDNRGYPDPNNLQERMEDPFRAQIMAAWGGFTHDRDDKWNTDVVTSGLFVYAMAAFARRVFDRPDLYPQFHAQAIALVDAVIDTYEAFHSELRLLDNYAYYVFPFGYGILTCSNGAKDCEDYRNGAGLEPISYNENLSMMQALAELALAANSNTYRASADATQLRMDHATKEGPLAVARNVAWRVADLQAVSFSDLTPYYLWDYADGDGRIEDVAHAQFELGSLAVILDDQIRLNALLAANGQTDRIPLSLSMFVRFTNTFLRKVWVSNNTLSGNIDGSNDNGNTVDCAGWVPLAQFDPWVWRRCRDITFNPNSPGRRVDNHGALLRYRRFNSMQYLTDFAGQNWLITPAALAVGEKPPTSIRDQKWLLILSGVVISNFKGDSAASWNTQTVSFIPDMAGTDDPTSTSGPLNWAISQYNIPRPAGTVGKDYLVRFALDEWSPFVTLGSIFDQDQSINAGFAVNDWRPNPFDSGKDVVSGAQVGQIFTGVVADLAVSDSDAWLYRLNYNITLLGQIVFIAPPVIF